MRAYERKRAWAGGVVVMALLTVLTASAEAAKPSYGVVPQDGAVPPRSEIEEMAAGGVKDIRLILHWGSVEQQPGQYNWNGVDAMVRETTNYGVKPFFFLYGTPDWAANIDGRKHCDRKPCVTYPPVSGKTQRAFAHFARAAVERYGPDGDFWEPPSNRGLIPVPCEPVPLPGCTPDDPVDPTPTPEPPTEPPPPPPSPPPPLDQPPCGCTEAHPLRAWQLWNEQNSPKYYAPKVDIKTYAKLVKGAGKAIHKEDPGADVVLGGAWGPKSASKVVLPLEPYLEQLYKVKGIEKSFDSIAIHPYAANTAASLAQMKVARRVAKQEGDRKVGTWVTEIGWAAGGPTSNPYVKGLDGQAKLLRKTLGKFDKQKKSLRLRGVFWYSWRDLPGGDEICDWCGYAGLRNADGSAKPAWAEFSKLAKR